MDEPSGSGAGAHPSRGPPDGPRGALCTKPVLALFRSQRLNVIVGQWFCAYPILSDSEVYGASIAAIGWLERETIRTSNYQENPVSRERLGRKLRRDLTGQTGFKLLRGFISGKGGSIMMRAGEEPNATGDSRQSGLFLALTLVAHFELFWIGAY